MMQLNSCGYNIVGPENSRGNLPSRPTLSYQRLQSFQPLTDEELYDKLRRTVPNKHELQVLESFLIFNKCVWPPFSSSPLNNAI